MNNASPAKQLSQLGTSIWLDDLSRGRIQSGNLADLIASSNVVGVTTNPTIFAQALAADESYTSELAQLAEDGTSPEEAVFQLTCADVTAACDVLRPVYETSGGTDGRVSIEVSPLLAHDTEATVAAAVSLWERINRPNLLIKIPATIQGLAAISEVLGLGLSVNVTLIFSLERYREVINAYLSGLERARANGIDLSTIHSVASFFVSRVDTAIDSRLRALGSPEALALTGTAGVANARVAYQIFLEMFDSERARFLQTVGANVQRPLWASTGVKDPSLPDTLYVTELAGPSTVNTMPEGTLKALIDHGVLSGDRLTTTGAMSNQALNALAHVGIQYVDVVRELEDEGIEKFVASWNDLLKTVSERLQFQ